MRKALIIAAREYAAAVRTRSFLIGLVIMPLMMSGSLLIQLLVKDHVDARPRRYAVIDRTPGGHLAGALIDAARRRDEVEIRDPATGTLKATPFELERIEAPGDAPEALARTRLALSERVRREGLAGVLEIGPEVLAGPRPASAAPADDDRAALRYQTGTPTSRDFPRWAAGVLNDAVRDRRLEAAGLPRDRVLAALAPVPLRDRGLTRREAASGAIAEAPERDRIAALMAPVFLVMIMFMIISVGTTPLMQGVLEEKQQRIAEVLLGSVRPFDLMLGKLAGMAGVALTTVAVYLAGGSWAAWHFGYADYVEPAVLGWFVAFLMLAVPLYGSLFIAVGAACTDAKEAQTLLLPVMLLICAPLFALGPILKEPNGALAVGLSFFPFATPMVMVIRLAIPPGAPAWQAALGMAGVLATTVACVWAAGRIFRVGLLTQGKGAGFAQMARWIVRG